MISGSTRRRSNLPRIDWRAVATVELGPKRDRRSAASALDRPVSRESSCLNESGLAIVQNGVGAVVVGHWLIQELRESKAIGDWHTITIGDIDRLIHGKRRRFRCGA